jgi:spore maturation protein SpmA
MKKRPTLFAIFLHEEDGVVTVTADYLGLGQASFDLGIEIMTGIKELEREHPKQFTVRHIQISEYYN